MVNSKIKTKIYNIIKNMIIKKIFIKNKILDNEKIKNKYKRN